MFSSSVRFFVLLGLCATAALPLYSQESSEKKSATSKSSKADKKTTPGSDSPSDAKKPIDLKKLDLAFLPPEAIIVLCEKADEALKLVPNAVLLTPGKYQEMLEQIERLKKQLQLDKPATPTRCDLRGKVESGAVRLEAEFSGTAERANTLVTLGCAQAGASAAQTDGKLALIRRGESGAFVVQIEKPGDYHVKLDLILPLATRESNGKGFELTLPRAAITNLELDLPSNAREVRVGGRALTDPELAGLKQTNQHLSGNPALGPVEKLDLTWKEALSSSGVAVLTAEGRIQVRFDASGHTTEADLLLKVEGAATNTWRLLVPLGAEVKILPPDEKRIKGTIETADQKYASLRTIRLKEPSSEPLHVRVQVRGSLPPSRSSVAVGPFFVLGAARQSGTIVVRNPVRHLHLDYRTHGDMQLRRRQTEDTGGDAPVVTMTFDYTNIPLVDKPQGVSASNALSWLDLEAETVHVPLRTRVAHMLILRPGVTRDGMHWEIVTTITPVGKWAEGEPLKVFVPREWRSTDESLAVTAQSNPPCVVVPASLLRGSPTASQRLIGRYEPIQPRQGRTILSLPRPQGQVEQCEVKLEVPSNCEVALHNAEAANLELAKQTRLNEQTWRIRLVPPSEISLDVSWRQHRPELRVASVADLTLTGNRGEVRHEMRVQLPATPPASLRLRVPAGIQSLKINDPNDSGFPEKIPITQGSMQVPIPDKLGGTQWRLVLRYSIHLDETKTREGAPFLVPLVVTEEATGGDVKVRIWSEPGALPLPVANADWEEKNIEEVKDRSELPILVLQSARRETPLLLRLNEQVGRFTVLVERSLVRVKLLESGDQSWHISYQLGQLVGSHLDIELPGPIRVLQAKFFLNRRQVPPDILDSNGERIGSGTVARLRLAPELIHQSALLDIVYLTPPGRTSQSPLRTSLFPPELRQAATTFRSKWLVSIPSNRVLIAPESAAELERAFTRQGWLLSARLQRSGAELEREFAESLPAELRQEGDASENDVQAAPSLVCWQDHASPLVLTHAPQQGWLLVCSLGLLLVSLGLYAAARPRAGSERMASWFWPLVAFLSLLAALGVLFWPTIFWAIVYGCEPSVVVLLVVLVLQWLLHQRYRRQILFLPSFSRDRPGSSLVKKSAVQRPVTGEPSTVDAPPSAPS